MRIRGRGGNGSELGEPLAKGEGVTLVANAGLRGDLTLGPWLRGRARGSGGGSTRCSRDFADGRGDQGCRGGRTTETAIIRAVLDYNSSCNLQMRQILM